MMKQTVQFLLTGSLFVLLSFTVNAADQQESSILATRGKGVVSQDLFDARMKKVPEKDHRSFLVDSDRFKTVLTTMLLHSQLAADAEEAGFQHQADIAIRLKLASDNLLANLWLENYVETNSVADYELLAKEYYALHKKEIKKEGTVDVTHLLINARQGDVSDQRRIAEDLLRQVQENPEKFDALVLEWSEDPSAESNQGRFTGVKRGDMDESFEEAAFGLEQSGDFSALVQSTYGFHIIRLDASVPDRQLSFDEARKSIIAQQQARDKERVHNNYLSELAALEVVIPENAVTDMLVRYFGEAILEEIEKANSVPESE